MTNADAIKTGLEALTEEYACARDADDLVGLETAAEKADYVARHARQAYEEAHGDAGTGAKVPSMKEWRRMAREALG